jgi:large subunit ribosomal protein L24
MLGPLAPNRLAGKDSGSYGMMNYQSIRTPPVLAAERPKYFNFAVDDRVVVINGREKGKIGKVTEIDQERQTVGILDVNIVSLSNPE